MGVPRRKRTERKKPAETVDRKPVSLWQAPMPAVGVIDPRCHPSSPEFHAAYNAYFDSYPAWVDAPPLQAMAWRERAISGSVA